MTELELMVLQLQERVEELETDNHSLIVALDRTQESIGKSIEKLIKIQQVLESESDE